MPISWDPKNPEDQLHFVVDGSETVVNSETANSSKPEKGLPINCTFQKKP